MRPEGKESFPSQFGRYTLVERLATGGMAEVFKAKIVSTHGFEKPLVIKRILPHLAADKTFVSMFIDEAKVTAQLIHPKIVQVTDFGDVEGQFFIAMEFVEGFDALALLRTAAQRQVRLPIPVCMFIVIEVLDALDYAHNAKDPEGKAMRIVHRDISPSNVFIARRGDVKLGDFGIAHAQERESKTQAGTLKGKYGYMSPEQVVGGSLDGRSDLFAVGIVLAEMLMGRRLFTAPNDLDVLLMVRDGRLERLDKYCKDLPPDLDQVLRTALKKKVGERFQTAADFRDALSDLVFRMGFRVGPSDLGRLAVDYFDPSPEALTRVKQHAERWRVRAVTGVNPTFSPSNPMYSTGFNPVFNPAAIVEGVTPPPLAAHHQRQEWGVPPTPQPVPVPTSPPPRPAPAEKPQSRPHQAAPPPSSHGHPAHGAPAPGHQQGRGLAPGVAPAPPSSQSHARSYSQPRMPVPSPAAPPPARPHSAPPSGRSHPGRPALHAEPDPRGQRARMDSDAHRPSPMTDLNVVVEDDEPLTAAVSPPAADRDPDRQVMAALDQALSQPLSIVDLDQYEAPTGEGMPAVGGDPMGASRMGGGGLAGGGGGVPEALPDQGGDLTVLSPMRVFADLAVAGETGMLRVEHEGVLKDLYLVRGAPESVTSNQPVDRFAQYLVSRGFLRPADLELAQGQLPRFAGKLPDTLVNLGLLKAQDVVRLQAQHVRERLMDLFSWTQGQFAFFRGVRNPSDAVTLGLDSFEILGASVLTLSFDALQGRFALLAEFRPKSVPQPRIVPEAFKLGNKPRELYSAMDGRRTVNELMARFTSPSDLLTFLRMLYLLLETDLVRLE